MTLSILRFTLLAGIVFIFACSPLLGADLRETRALAFVAVLNQNDADEYEAFMQDNLASAVLESALANDQIDSFADLKRDLGALEVQGVMRVSDVETRVLVHRSATDEAIEIVFGHESTDAAKLTTIEFVPFLPQVEVPSDWSNLEDLLQHYAKLSGVPAWAVAVVADGKIVDSAAAGTKELGSQRSVSLDDRFHWGSVTKSFTATLAAILVGQGKISWDTRVVDLFDPKTVRSEYHNVTLTELLNHRSGLPTYDDFTEEFMRSLNRARPNDGIAQRAYWVSQILQHDRPIYAPGEGHRYSNGGYTVAGRMLELAAGKSWEVLAEELLFKPLGMHDAGLGWPQSIDPSAPAGHFGTDSGELTVAPPMLMADLLTVTAPAGNVHSSIEDFARYALLHLDGLQVNGELTESKVRVSTFQHILQSHLIQHLHTPPTAELARDEPYSFGWSLRKLNTGVTMHSHNGGAGSFYAEIRLIPEQDVGFVILANAGAAERYIEPLLQVLASHYLNN